MVASTEIPGSGSPRRAKPSPPKPARKKPVTDRKANTKGKVLIVEYHKIEPTESRWARTPANFRKDLERLYKAGFRPVTLSEYLSGKMDIPPGASPVVFTFDDGSECQYRILPNGEIDPNCAVGIWLKFNKTRPDFPLKATFFVLPPQPFVKKATAKKKIENLVKWGSEIGIHTLTHRPLSKLPDDAVKKEIAGSIDWLRGYGVNARTMAMPYGIYPNDKSLLKMFRWNGKIYSLDGAVRVGAIPALPPSNPKLYRWGLPRIQGVDIDYGLTWWLGQIKKDNVDLYVQP